MWFCVEENVDVFLYWFESLNHKNKQRLVIFFSSHIFVKSNHTLATFPCWLALSRGGSSSVLYSWWDSLFLHLRALYVCSNDYFPDLLASRIAACSCVFLNYSVLLSKQLNFLFHLTGSWNRSAPTNVPTSEASNLLCIFCDSWRGLLLFTII